MDRRNLLKNAILITTALKAPMVLAKMGKGQLPLARGNISIPQTNDHPFKVLIEINRFSKDGQDRDIVKSQYIKGSIQSLNRSFIKQGKMGLSVMTKGQSKITWEYSFSDMLSYQSWRDQIESHYIDFNKAHELGFKEKVSFPIV